MRTVKSLLFLAVIYLIVVPLRTDLSAQICLATHGQCNSNESCTPSPPLPSCDDLCRNGLCHRFFTGIEPTNACGNSAAGNCQHPKAFVSKQCTCEGSACKTDNASCGSDAECCSQHCSNVMGTCNNDGTPILINVEERGLYDLTSADDGVTFDIFADGRPVQLAWTNPDSDAGFLVLDRDENGSIDDAGELFGNYTLKRDGTRAGNGFEALHDLDGGRRSDGRVDERDSVYRDLKLWFDRNHDGQSSPNELVGLARAGVTTIFTAYRVRQYMDPYGNKYAFEGVAMIRKNRREVPRRVYDVILKRKPLVFATTAE
jgi:hypothetical protein